MLVTLKLDEYIHKCHYSSRIIIQSLQVEAVILQTLTKKETLS